MLRWHRWLHTARDADGTGLACILHADQDLRILADSLGEPVEEIDGWLDRMRTSSEARFWDERVENHLLNPDESAPAGDVRHW